MFSFKYLAFYLFLCFDTTAVWHKLNFCCTLFVFPLQRLWSTPAASPPWCSGKRCPPSPRTWTPTPTACPSGCVRASPPSTSRPWSLCGCSPWAWWAATPTCWSHRSECPAAPCCSSRWCRTPALRTGRSTWSTANTPVRAGLWLPLVLWACCSVSELYLQCRDKLVSDNMTSTISMLEIHNR